MKTTRSLAEEANDPNRHHTHLSGNLARGRALRDHIHTAALQSYDNPAETPSTNNGVPNG